MLSQVINQMRSRIFRILFFLCLVSFGQESADDLYLYDNFESVGTENIFKTDGYFNWGTSIIKDNHGKYHLFYSRWSKEYGFLGWLTHSEIAHATSRSPAGPWKFKETILKGSGEDNWDAITAHNPKIKYFNGKYYLYYISTHMGDRSISDEELIATAKTGYTHKNWKTLRENQRTVVAISTSLKGPWVRSENTLIEPSGPITTLTVNPAIAQGSDEKYYLVVKGDKPNEERFIRNQAVAIADHPDGPFEMQSKPVIDYQDTEDMSIWFDKNRNRFYGVFHTHGFIGMVTSYDGINWNRANEYVLMTKELKMKDGSTLIPDRLERPFIYTENGVPKVLGLAARKGDESYSIFIPIKENKYPIPNSRQLAWQEAELGVIFHYDLHVFDGKKYNQSSNRIDPIMDYQIFNPKDLNTDQWIKAAKDAGARFAILTATHETGFALFQSEVNPYSLKALEWKDGKADIVGDFVASCKKYGIKPGIYLGIRWNSFFGVHDFKVNGEGDFKVNRQKKYNEMVEGMVKEICTNYGELFEIWFDGGADHPDNGAPDVLPIVRQFQPNCLFYHNGQLAEARWGGSESGTVSYPSWSTFPYRETGAGESAKENIAKDNFKLLKEGDPNGTFWVPAMSDAPLRGYNGRHEWFWEPGDEEHIFPLDDLMNMYYKSVGRNSTLIIGITPDHNGLLPVEDVIRLREWGSEIEKRFSSPLKSTSGIGDKIYLKFDKPTVIDHVVIQEDIVFGESIRQFIIEGKVDGKWKEIAKGSSVGHKRILQFDEVEVESVRLIIKKFERRARVKSFSAYIMSENQ